MHVIKKYTNRKLYHTNQKQYITLDGIAQLARSGTPVQVLDNETGEDITASILMQVILHTRERSGGILPTNVLMSMIQLGGDALSNLRQTIFTALGVQDRIEVEIHRRLDRLTAEGSLTPDEATRLRALLLRHDFSLSTTDIPDDVPMTSAAVPDRSDIVRLQHQIDALTQAIEQISQQQGQHEKHKTQPEP